MKKFTKHKFKQSAGLFTLAKIKKLINKKKEQQSIAPEVRIQELYELKYELKKHIPQLMRDYARLYSQVSNNSKQNDENQQRIRLESNKVYKLYSELNDKIKDIDVQIKNYEDKFKEEQNKKKSVLDKLFDKLCLRKAEKIKNGTHQRKGIAYNACNYIFPDYFIDNTKAPIAYYKTQRNTNGNILSITKSNNLRSKKSLYLKKRVNEHKQFTYRKLNPIGFKYLERNLSPEKFKIIDELEKMATIKQLEFLFDNHINIFSNFLELQKLSLSQFEKEILKILNSVPKEPYITYTSTNQIPDQSKEKSHSSLNQVQVKQTSVNSDTTESFHTPPQE